MELLGRERELAEVTARLRERRLVTVTGPGGIGKTRLAAAAAAIVGPEFEHGSVVVDLTRVDQPAGVAEALAGQLGYADFQSLMNSPGDEPALMVFDNCEHVLDAAAAVTEQILAACRMPTILATSRSPLDLGSESVYALGPLATPPAEVDEPDVAAMRLLIDRAADHDVALDEADLALAAEVCRRLDGVPLAIEIAAARLRSVTLADLLDELAARPHALARPRFRGKPTHRSVADMVGWSFELLDDADRTFFTRLGMFAGPFTAAMAAAVAGGRASEDGTDEEGADEDGPDLHDARDRLDSLVAASLVVADTSGDTAWFRLLHPVRAVAIDRLRTSGELAATQSRLVDHVVELALGVIERASTGWGGSVLNDLLALYDDIAAALRWTLDNDEDPGRSLVLLAVLWGVVHQAHTAEIGGIGERVIARWDDPATPGWADAAATVATCRNLLGDPDGAIALATATLPHADPSPFAPATLRRVLAQTNRALRRLEEARDWFDDGATTAAERGAHGFAMELAVDHALLVAELGDVDRALALVGDVVTEADERGARINHAWALAGRGAIVARRDAAEAVPVIEEAIATARRIAYPAGLSFSLRALASVSIELDDLPGAASALLDLIDELLQRGGLNDLRMALDHAALVLEATGDPVWADLAVTAASLPVTTVGVAVDQAVFERARELGTVLSIRDAYVVSRRSLRTVRDGAAPNPATDDPTARQTTPTTDPPAGSTTAVMERDGDVWRIEFGGGSVSLRASKGLTDLAVLVAAPGREFPALELAGARLVPGTEDDLLDATARRQYEERARELQGEIDEADADHDLGRAERLREEFDALVDQLTSASGLGGRTRRTTGEAERARSAVTQRIRSTIKRIDQEHPELGAHLRASVSTGALCGYRPPTAVRWTVRR